MEVENAEKVIGLKALVENIEVKLVSFCTKTDIDIANEMLACLRGSGSVPDEKVIIKVEEGWVILDGGLAWNNSGAWEVKNDSAINNEFAFS